MERPFYRKYMGKEGECTSMREGLGRENCVHNGRECNNKDNRTIMLEIKVECRNKNVGLNNRNRQR